MPERARRLRAGLILVTIWLAVGQARLVWWEGPGLALRAGVNSRRLLPVPAVRGAVFDRHGTRLAGTRTVLTVVLSDPTAAGATAAMAALAAALFPAGTGAAAELERWQARVEAARVARSLPVTLIADLTPAQHARLVEIGLPPGVLLLPMPQRHYPRDRLAVHVLDGMERSYAGVLAGRPGLYMLTADARGRLRIADGTQGPQPGQDLHLGLDARLQAQVEVALAEHLRWIRRASAGEYAPRRAAAVVLDLRTGAVRAMASLPGYDPNRFARGLTPEEWQSLTTDPDQPLNNWALAAFPPGSTYKMVTALAALGSGRVQPDEVITCSGRYWDLHRPADWLPQGHGPVTLTRALAESCDVYFYEMGRRVGPNALQQVALQFGLGRPTGVDLPSEPAGQAAGLAEYGHRWQPGEVLSLAIGQGYNQVTPLQMAVYTGALATGQVVQPYLVQEVRTAGGRTDWQREPVVRPLPLDPVHLQAVRRGMQAAAHDPGGTAAWAFADFPLTVGAKTGTAEDPPRADVAWTVAYAPADRPEVAVAVVIPGGGHGSWAAPVARAVLAAWFGLPPETAWPPAMAAAGG